MKQNTILIVLLLLFLGCDRGAPHIDHQVDSSLRVHGHKQLDFKMLLDKIQNCNDQELTYFKSHWNEIHEQLKDAANDGLLADLPMNQQEELWYALAYLQGFRDGNVMREHGDDMVKILFTFGTEGQLAQLRSCYPEPKNAR